MSSDRPKSAFRNVPAPPGSKAGTSYSRFIPREELGDVSAWKPGAFGGAGERRATPRPEVPPEATAAELRAHFDRERQAIRQAGYQDGYRDGLAALESFKQHFAQQATAQIGALLEGFDRQLQQLDVRIAEQLTRAAVQLARQVVRSELAARPELVAQVAAEALGAVMLSARHITVHLHPADLPLVAAGADEALKARGARLVADESLARGDVRVESEVGSVDARVATRWAQAATQLGHEEPWAADADAASEVDGAARGSDAR